MPNVKRPRYRSKQLWTQTCQHGLQTIDNEKKDYVQTRLLLGIKSELGFDISKSLFSNDYKTRTYFVSLEEILNSCVYSRMLGKILMKDSQIKGSMIFQPNISNHILTSVFKMFYENTRHIFNPLNIDD